MKITNPKFLITVGIIVGIGYLTFGLLMNLWEAGGASEEIGTILSTAVFILGLYVAKTYGWVKL